MVLLYQKGLGLSSLVIQLAANDQPADSGNWPQGGFHCHNCEQDRGSNGLHTGEAAGVPPRRELRPCESDYDIGDDCD